MTSLDAGELRQPTVFLVNEGNGFKTSAMILFSAGDNLVRFESNVQIRL